MGTYVVPYVAKKHLSAWNEFWVSEKKPSEKTNKLMKRGLLGLAEIIKAKTKKEAATIVSNRYPSCVVITESIEKIG